MQWQIHFTLAEATPLPEFTALQHDQLLQKRAPSSTSTTEAGSGLLTSPREKNKSKFPYFSPWASQRTGTELGTSEKNLQFAVTSTQSYFRLSLSNFGGGGGGGVEESDDQKYVWVARLLKWRTNCQRCTRGYFRLLRSSWAEMF